MVYRTHFQAAFLTLLLVLASAVEAWRGYDVDTGAPSASSGFSTKALAGRALLGTPSSNWVTNAQDCTTSTNKGSLSCVTSVAISCTAASSSPVHQVYLAASPPAGDSSSYMGAMQYC
jgi:hypothetical protein